MLSQHKLLIASAPLDGVSSVSIVDPASSAVLGFVPRASVARPEQAIRSIERCFPVRANSRNCASSASPGNRTRTERDHMAIGRNSGSIRAGMLLAGASAALALAGCGQKGDQSRTGSSPQTVVAQPAEGVALTAAGADPKGWSKIGGGYAEQRYSPLEQINEDNVGSLKLAWSYDLDTNRGQEATPVVMGGILYTSTAWSKVLALDARTGKEKWTFDPKVPGFKGVNPCCDVVNRGVAVEDGKVFVGTIDGRLIALDAATGKPLWSVQTTDPNKPYSITGAPRVVHGKVIIGNGGAELGVRGFVSAYNANTGKMVWRFYTTPNPTNAADGQPSDKILQTVAFKTWGNGEWKKTGGGGTAWDSIVYDPDLNQLLIGTGNGSPWNRTVRSGDKGDNLFLSSIVAVDPDTGAYKWHYQETPGEEWDFTATQPIMLANVSMDGKVRKVAFHAPKNGVFYVIDRTTGKPISADKFVNATWLDHVDLKTGRPVEAKGARYSEDKADVEQMPSAFGAHNWFPMSYSPKTGLVYFPVQEIPFGYGPAPEGYKYNPKQGVWNLAVASARDFGPQSQADFERMKKTAKGYLLAWDPIGKKPAWRVEFPTPGNGGTLATAGNLVFIGQPDGMFKAFRATDGKELWKFDAQTGILAGAASFELGGKQYIALMVGMGGAFGLHSPFAPDPHLRPNGRVLVFSLGGTAKLPPYERIDLPATPSNETFAAQSVARGKLTYAGACAFCHGFSAWSTQVLPDLRRSGYIQSQEAFDQVLLHGALQDQGMVNFSNRLSPQDTKDLRAYLNDRARQLQTDQKAGAK
ncbi:PQQ-dependent dehydrogenase, methanol/ethanol family [Sphingomonas sp. IW22]|jgi:quinohemoprotein ethanol dehydrogenase|uniref:PQQ-dependent dehydrogenase, methanol/ethanol family n=1 Tax=Sphingomonas sp. IW22 TaxID=3242489 RepID=UPI00351FAAC1